MKIFPDFLIPVFPLLIEALGTLAPAPPSHHLRRPAPAPRHQVSVFLTLSHCRIQCRARTCDIRARTCDMGARWFNHRRAPEMFMLIFVMPIFSLLVSLFLPPSLSASVAITDAVPVAAAASASAARSPPPPSPSPSPPPPPPGRSPYLSPSYSLPVGVGGATLQAASRAAVSQSPRRDFVAELRSESPPPTPPAAVPCFGGGAAAAAGNSIAPAPAASAAAANAEGPGPVRALALALP